MLEIKNLHSSVTDDSNIKILNGVNLSISPGEVHVIMGPNGSGKSTLANLLMGRPDYEITEGEIKFDNKLINELPTDKRSHLGMFLAFQYPVEVPGVRPWQFLKASLDSKYEALDQEKISVREFNKIFEKNVEEVGIKSDLIKRSLNEGFSGGEKKRNEILQLKILKPKLAIMDETDSGLDIDALKVVSEGINSMRSEERSFLIVTHYQRLLNYVKPDFVHVLIGGEIVKSGRSELALEIENSGYKSYIT
ncbi:MAG: Fe-S cluster assembly ATPase SufC [Chloroflexi bacterium]|nr:Fe-S cluster assembly ATPase SufC [Chloroflexota bacterium]|tara:strand:- start:8732 stop:9481 length:750 start_codon:yes stop_codon:yes gene_type:complete